MENCLESTKTYQESNESEEICKAWNFGHLAPVCAVYSLIFVLCMYKNSGAITTPVWIASLIALVAYLRRSTGKELKKGSIFLAAVMMIIGASCFYTANPYTLFANYVAEFMLFVTFVLLNYADISKWDIGKLLGEIFASSFLSVGMIHTPFSDGNAFLKRRGSNKSGYIGKIFIGLALSVPVLVILGVLLSSADAVFGNMFDRLFCEIANLRNIVQVVFMLLLGFFSAYCGMRYVNTNGANIKVTDHRTKEPVVPITVLALVSIMYLAFSVIQILYLFIGGFKLPQGVTYAEYARSGFFQLLFVSALNLIVVLVMKKYIVRSRILDILLLLICACTYIMIASSAIRMIMYIREYHLTYDRILVLVVLLTLAVLFAGVVVYVIKESFPFMQFAVTAVCLLYIVFAFANVDRLIASYNLNRAGSGEYHQDMYYISELSTDAAPVISEYLEKQAAKGSSQKYATWYSKYCRKNGINGGSVGIRSFNISKYVANKVLR
ncbi:MAG: DUF4173 domain-containing protein [Lachnospiraceae bacterium]|nr:DUF4173 domain-containing protein [Lachnospiraceae bacterium]